MIATYANAVTGDRTLVGVVSAQGFCTRFVEWAPHEMVGTNQAAACPARLEVSAVNNLGVECAMVLAAGAAGLAAFSTDGAMLWAKSSAASRADDKAVAAESTVARRVRAGFRGMLAALACGTSRTAHGARWADQVPSQTATKIESGCHSCTRRAPDRRWHAFVVGDRYRQTAAGARLDDLAAASLPAKPNNLEVCDVQLDRKCQIRPQRL